MKKTVVLLVVLLLLLVPSCKSEEEKAMDEKREMYTYVVDSLADLMKDSPFMSSEDVAMVDEAKAEATAMLKEAETLDEIDEAGENGAAGLLFMSLFVLDEDTLASWSEEAIDKYPDLAPFLE